MRLFFAVFLASIASAQQTVPVQQIIVENAANAGLQSVAAPGSLISISPLPPIDGGTFSILSPASVEIGGESAQIVSGNFPGQVIVLVPSDLPLGPATLQVSPGYQPPQSTTITIVPSDFGLFTGALNAINGQNINLTHPAHPGDYVSLWGTGLGTAAQDQVKVLLGGHPAPVLYAGPAPGLPGKNQINFQVPDDAAIPDGCFVAVQVEVQGVASNTIAISKSAGSDICTPPFDLTGDQMKSLDAGESVPFASFLIDGFVSAPPPRPSLESAGLVRNESFEATAFPLNETSILSQTQPLVADDAYYGCTLSPAGPGGIILINNGIVNLGPELTLTGPGTTAHILPQAFGGYYEVSLPTGPPVSSPEYLPPPYFVPGVWQVSSPGAISNPFFVQQYAAASFQAQITLPPTLQLTNFSSLQNIDSTQPLTIQWNPSGYGSADVVTITVGASGLEYATTPPQIITCRAPATDGQFSISSSLLAGLSANSYLQISLTRRPDQMIRTDIPLQSGETAPGIFTYSFTESFPVKIQ